MRTRRQILRYPVVMMAACLLGDPDGDVVTPGWFVHVRHCKRKVQHGMRHFRSG
jgi:hypothetical protein